jgi:hypothetical protein
MRRLAVAVFNTPCTVIMGVVAGRAVYVELNSGERLEEPVNVSIDSAEPRIGEGELLSGHIAITSLSTTIVKAVALSKPAYVLELGGLRPLARGAVSVRGVRAREFSAWEQVWNKPVYLSAESPTLVACASRAGPLLNITVAPSDVELASVIAATTDALKGAGEVSLNCTCRLRALPCEVFAVKGSAYALARFYLNSSSPKWATVLFVAGEGGITLHSVEVELPEAARAARELAKYLLK